MKAPAVVEVTLPAELAEGCEFVTSGRAPRRRRARGACSSRSSAAKPGPRPAARPVAARGGRRDRARRGERFEAAFDAFRRMFPPALCYAKIVPVDEVITLTLFHREDDQLRRLMLDDAQAAQLDRLWDELRFVSQDALTLVDAFQQLLEYASQDGDPKVFEPLRKPIQDRAAAFRKALVDAEPRQLDAAIAFAEKAYRRPLTAGRGRRAARPLPQAPRRGTAARRRLAAGAGPGAGLAGVPLPGRDGRPGDDGRRPCPTGSWPAA